MLHTALEIEAHDILAKLGRGVYNGAAHTRSKFLNIRGCVVMDLSEDLPVCLAMELDGVRCFRVNVDYRQLTDTCTICKESGHLPQLCPRRVVNSPRAVSRSPRGGDVGREKEKSAILTPIRGGSPRGVETRAPPGSRTPPPAEATMSGFRACSISPASGVAVGSGRAPLWGCAVPWQ